MTGHRKVVCADCGGYERDVGPISRGSLCTACGVNRQVENARQIAAREGPYYDRWLYGWTAAGLRLASERD